MATALYLNGFENRVNAVGGIVSGIWQSFTGTAPTIETSLQRTGVACVKAAMPGGSSFQGNWQCRVFDSTPTSLATRFYFRKSGNPSTNVRIFQVAVVGSVFMNIRIDSSGQLQIEPSGGTSPVNSGTSAALSNDTWYCVDFVVTSPSTSQVARLWVDDTVVSGDATQTGTGAGAMTRASIGVPNTTTISTARDLYWDDWIVGTPADIDDRFGPSDGIFAIVPDNDGTHSPSPPTAAHFEWEDGTDVTWNGSSGNKASGKLDSADLTQSTEYVQQTAVAGTEYLEVTFGTKTLSAAAPLGVQGEAGLNTDGTGAFTADTRMRNGAAETVLFSGDWSIAAGTQSYKARIVSVASQSELDGLTMRFGYCGNQPAIPRWTTLMYEVDVGKSSGTVYEKQNASVLF